MTPPSLRELALVLAVAAAGAAFALAASFRGPALADEFVYQVGARRFAETNSLAATYYLSDGILSVGHPHQDLHSPGYVIVLGVVSRVLGPGYLSAVALNVASLLLSVALLWQLAGFFGRPAGARLLTVAAIAVPGLLAYSTWVMAEWFVVVSSLVTVWVAARWGTRPSGALLCGVALGGCVLVRESGIFLVPALVLLIGRSRLRLSLLAGAFLAFQLLVSAPLNSARPPFASTTVSGSSVNSESFRAAREGRVLDSVRQLAGRAERNIAALPSAGTEQQLTLFWLLAVPALAWLSWGELASRARLMLIGLSLGLAAVVLATVTLTDLVGWNGPRYWTFLTIPFFSLLPHPVNRGRQGMLFVVIALCLATSLSILFTFRRFKSQGAQTDEVAYFDRYAPPDSYTRVVWQNGYKLGVRRYPVEVIVSLPQSREEYRALARAVWFDYVVLSTWQDVLDDKGRYVLVNRDDPDPLLKIFRRLR